MNMQNKLEAQKHTKSNRLRLFEMIVCTLFGTLMFCSKQIMALLPNIHLLGMFVMLVTVVFRFRGLISIYVFVFLEGLLGGFSLWWIPYLYVWTVLWALTMLVPKRLPVWAKTVIYPIICALHGFGFGILYSPAQALLFGLDFKGMIAWIIAGFPFDIIHGISNFCAGFLILPLELLLNKMIKKIK